MFSSLLDYEDCLHGADISCGFNIGPLTVVCFGKVFEFVRVIQSKDLRGFEDTLAVVLTLIHINFYLHFMALLIDF